MLFRFLTFLFVIPAIISNAQNYNFSVFSPSDITLNPANAGNNSSAMLRLAYRNQWAILPNAYASYFAAFDVGFKYSNSSLGVYAIKDDQGNNTFSQTEFNMVYSYKTYLNRKYILKFGFQTGYGQYVIDSQNLVFLSNIDPISGINTENGLNDIFPKHNSLDFGAGFACFSKNIYFGGSIQHLANIGIGSNIDTYNVLTQKYTAYFGTTIDINIANTHRKKVHIYPNVVFQQQGISTQLNYGLNFKHKVLTSGVRLRHDISGNMDALIFLFGTNFTNLSLIYAYDYTLSELFMGTYGSHEIVMSYNLGKSLKFNKSKAVECPAF